MFILFYHQKHKMDFSHIIGSIVLLLLFSFLFVTVIFFFDECKYDYMYNSDVMLFCGPFINKTAWEVGTK